MATKKPVPAIMPCWDNQRRTCLMVDRVDGKVKYIPLSISEGLEVLELAATEFDRRYEPMVNYPSDKAAQLYLGYSQSIGASTEALNYLGRVINVSKQEFHMATTKKAAATKAAEAKSTKAPANGVKAGRRTTDPVVKPAAKAPAAKGAKKESAAQMFQDLIMKGTMTDDQIFAKVQEKFGLDEKKRGYVKWYRNHLKKIGTKNVPEAKVGK